ncbi:hypothetical protein [Aquamicrobium sp.]|uniref:hypothetical protein n=1 Tax=Aquamicrobium sp. TaxID=1872579 RepID=UPI00349EF5D8
MDTGTTDEIAQMLSAAVDDMALDFPLVGFVLMAVVDREGDGSSVIAVKNIDDDAFDTVVKQLAEGNGGGLLLHPHHIN